MEFQQKDIVYFDDNRLIVMAGPFRTWNYPTIDQYLVASASLDDPEHLWGNQGYSSGVMAADLMSEAEYLEFLADEN